MPIYHRSPAVTWRRLPARLILAVPGSTTPLQLNATGAAVWDLLLEPIDASSLNERLAATFARPKAEMAPSVADLLDELVAAGAVVQQ